MITIISPHIDDAVLSIGGTIALLRARGEDVIVRSVFTRSHWTNPDNIRQKKYSSDVDEVTAIRAAEEQCTSKFLGYEYDLLGFDDHALRGKVVDQQLFDEVKVKIRSSLQKDSITFFPLGLQHHDHLVVSRIGYQLYVEGYKVMLYEDLPYAGFGNYDYEKQHDELIDRGMVPELVKIDFALKSEAIRKYESQISKQWLRDVTNYGYNVKTNEFYERVWRAKGNDDEMTSDLFT